MKVDVDTLLHDAFKIDAVPAHDAVAGALGTRLNEHGQFGFSLRRQTGLDATGLPIQNPLGRAIDWKEEPSCAKSAYPCRRYINKITHAKKRKKIAGPIEQKVWTSRLRLRQWWPWGKRRQSDG